MSRQIRGNKSVIPEQFSDTVSDSPSLRLIIRLPGNNPVFPWCAHHQRFRSVEFSKYVRPRMKSRIQKDMKREYAQISFQLPRPLVRLRACVFLFVEALIKNINNGGPRRDTGGKIPGAGQQMSLARTTMATVCE